MLEIDIEDDGVGFDVAEVGGPSASGRGLGILGMHERMELIGGYVEGDRHHPATEHACRCACRSRRQG